MVASQHSRATQVDGFRTRLGWYPARDMVGFSTLGNSLGYNKGFPLLKTL